MNIDTFISGDTGTDVVVPLKDENGAAFDMTGATAITLVCRSAQRDVFSVAGTIVGSAVDGVVSFEDVALAFTPTRQRPLVHFEGEVKWTQGGETHYSRDRVRFAIELFP
jgi:hypothetical protein